MTAGVTETPLADLPRWRIEALTRQPARDLQLYRTALTHKSALPPELRLEKVGDWLGWPAAWACWAGAP